MPIKVEYGPSAQALGEAAYEAGTAEFLNRQRAEAAAAARQRTEIEARMSMAQEQRDEQAQAMDARAQQAAAQEERQKDKDWAKMAQEQFEQTAVDDLPPELLEDYNKYVSEAAQVWRGVHTGQISRKNGEAFIAKIEEGKRSLLGLATAGGWRKLKKPPEAPVIHVDKDGQKFMWRGGDNWEQIEDKEAATRAKAVTEAAKAAEIDAKRFREDRLKLIDIQKKAIEKEEAAAIVQEDKTERREVRNETRIERYQGKVQKAEDRFAKLD